MHSDHELTETVPRNSQMVVMARCAYSYTTLQPLLAYVNEPKALVTSGDYRMVITTPSKHNGWMTGGTNSGIYRRETRNSLRELCSEFSVNGTPYRGLRITTTYLCRITVACILKGEYF
jgi:hypothetical protein